MLFWVTISSPCEKLRNLQSLIKLLKLPFKIPCNYLLGCYLSGNKSSFLFMLVCWIIAKFPAVDFSCRSMFTFLAFSDNFSPRGIRDETATFIAFANYIISLAISDGALLFFKLLVPVCKTIISGFRAMDGLMQSPMSFVAPGNDFIIIKHSLTELFKLRLGIYLIIKSPTIATVLFLFFPCRFYSIYVIWMMT